MKTALKRKPKVDDDAPILLRRIREVPEVTTPNASHMTVVTTQQRYPEKGDQEEDRTAPRRD